MSNKSKKLRPKRDKEKVTLLIAYASVVTAISALLKIIFDFIIQLLSLSK